ncbi:hypothetical protein [Acetobacter pasteurianus]|uniref:Uncharacterized protein n=1 Tax=Acetobacter pasteurianus subsp. pasteurianus TaxID=481145 RepID=A0A1Y0XY70_ACEPA|nr:hypothetical protein [Acetobacter pasteurianus]ARW47850.1 hypothetical protein S1001342_01524 [Acetobacter pasteurianus subsp. pasteurianus]
MWNDRAIHALKQSKNDRKFPQMMGAVHTPVRDRLLNMIKREFEPFRFAAEMLARSALKTPRAARNWLSGTNAPDAEALIELMASCDSIADEVNALVQQRRKEREGEKCRGLDSGSAVSHGSEHTADRLHPST